MTETKVIGNQSFDKVQGKIYTEVNGKTCQVKTKFSLNDIYMEQLRLKIKL